MSADPVREIVLAFVRLHILSHALDGPAYGVGLMRTLLHDGYAVGPGTLYPALHALEIAGFLESEAVRWEGRWRRVYRTTKSGGRLLREGRRKAEGLLKNIAERPA